MENEAITREIQIGGKRTTLYVSAEARMLLSENGICDPWTALQLHSMGDWGRDYEFYYEYYEHVRETVDFMSVFRKDGWEYWVMRKEEKISIVLPTEYDATWIDPAAINTAAEKRRG